MGRYFFKDNYHNKLVHIESCISALNIPEAFY